MVLCGVLAGFLILSTAGFIDQGLAQTLCTTDGWFGTNCQYQCHCANSAPCNKVDGSCSSGCDSDWFGPACQYIRATFTGSATWLTDNSDTSCNPWNSQSVSVVLNAAIPLTWVRVVVNNAVYLNQIQLTYQVTVNSAFQACTDPRTAKVDDVTLDIYCSTDSPVSRLTLSGLGVTSLCSLYISGGRNVALKQQAQQSSRHSSAGSNAFLARNAVDGRVAGNTEESTRSTCTHTDNNDNEKRWTVSFTRTVDVIRFLIYNRINCCRDRLIGFRLTAKPEPSSSNTPYTYTDPGTTAKDSYTDVPSPKINFPVSEVQIQASSTSNFLTLCEVFVFGERRCPANTFGLACERQCNCVSGGRSCFIHNGGCPDGCATNYAGEDCFDCAAGKYGANCGRDCSVNCGGDNSCDRTTGVCTHGCDPGFTGDRCLNECDAGWYGAGCSNPCSTNCAGSDNACNHVTGVCDNCPPGKYGPYCSGVCSVHCGGPNNACDRNTGACLSCPPGRYETNCLYICNANCGGSSNICNILSGDCEEGCDPGYTGAKCDQKCDAGWYGAGCSNPCSTNCAGSDNACNHVTGVCDNCPPGKYGPYCSGVCSVHCGGPNNACDRNTGECDDACDPGHWGQKCLQDCSETCAGPDNACDRISGRCESCDPTFYEDKCQLSCSSKCGGSEKTCEQSGGRCIACLPGYYGNTCTGVCSSNCGGTTCDRNTGACLSCPPGRYGTDCVSGCNANCGGSSNICNILSGDCEEGCDPGYTGAKCDQKCTNGTYGDGCGQQCSEHCAGDTTSCHHVNGTCDMGCDPGYQGNLCTDMCATGKWGLDCDDECNPSCADDCNHEDGQCACSPGYWGLLCQYPCNATTYGQDCLEMCSRDCVDQLCHYVTGGCASCPESKTGTFCGSLKQSGGGSGGSGGTTGAVVGAVVGVVVLIVIVAAVILWRRRRSNKKGQLQAEDGISGKGSLAPSPFSNKPAGSVEKQNRKSSNLKRRSKAQPKHSKDEISTDEDNDDESQENSYTNVVFGNTAVPVETLKTYILQHAADSHFKDEFLSIPMANSSPQTVGLSSPNIKKNRYKNIIPYDSSRVPLQTTTDKNQSDYINASFVKGYKTGETFIASQGPNDIMQNDFVRMLWEQMVDRVVMLTNLVELGKRKCNMYWPVDGEEEFGEISVKLLTTHVFAEYTVRHLHLSKNGEVSRELTQFHFTAWPDKSVPESPWGLIDLHQRVMSASGYGPILVHCSAGVGRTGTFIGLCNLLQEAEATGKMDFRTTLWKLRQERMHTIQTIAQYTFLHKAALVAYVVAGTTIKTKDLAARLSSLESDRGGNKAARSYLQEFEALVEVCDATSTKPTESPEVNEENVYQNTSTTAEKTKNRLSNILPNQTFRPALTAEAHREDTYINAVFVPNLNRNWQDFLTQLPLNSTTTDFWRLVTQYDVGLIVTYETELKSTDETIGDFLPKSEAEPFENDRFRVEMKSTRENKYFNEASLVVKKKIVPGMDSSTISADKDLVLLECKNTKLDPEVIFEVQEKIRNLRPSGKSRVVFMCRNGADHCGLSCVQTMLLDRLDADGCVAVPLVVGTIKAIRPQVIPTVDQYKCLYRVLKLAHDSQNVYGNM